MKDYLCVHLFLRNEDKKKVQFTTISDVRNKNLKMTHLGLFSLMKGLLELMTKNLELMKTNPGNNVFTNHNTGDEGLTLQHCLLTDQTT